MGFRITTWNVNGIRNPFGYQPWRDKRSFDAMFDILEADIVVFQETKIQRKDLRDDMVLVPGWDCFFSLPRVKKGYSGVVIYTRNATCCPIRAEEGVTGLLSPANSTSSFRDLPKEQQIGGYPTLDQLSEIGIDPATLDSEGRCVVLEFPAFVLLGVYSPANRDQTRAGFREAFFHTLDLRIRNLVSSGKRVILTGDLNVTPSSLDSGPWSEDLRKGVASDEEYLAHPVRRLFNQLVSGGRVIGEPDAGKKTQLLHDICRSFHPGRRGMYTCWETRKNARPGNFGSRIDYVLCTLDMKYWFSDSNIQEGLMGSDHCPVYATFKDEVVLGSATVNIQDIVNPEGMFKNGQRQREISTRDSLAISGRNIPEFTQRRSIKDMFSRRGSNHGNKTPRSLQMVSSSIASSTEKVESTISDTTSAENTKRPPSTNESKSPSKKLKTNAGVGRSSSLKGQQSLKGFFKPKVNSDTSTSRAINSTKTDEVSEEEHLQEASVIALEKPALPASNEDTPLENPNLEQNSHAAIMKDDHIIDPIVSKESWSRLFTKKTDPKCEGHQEPCIMLTTKKPGLNKGRAFWICSRPLGPSGEKEKGTQWRCGTFIWASDWNSPG